MNKNQKQILQMCAQQPMTTRQIVFKTGATASAIRSRLHILVKLGALTTVELNDQYGTRLYKTVPDWKPKHLESENCYKPLGICVLGVWM